MSVRSTFWQWLVCPMDLGRTLSSNLVVTQNFKLTDNLQDKFSLHLLQEVLTWAQRPDIKVQQLKG